MPLPLLNIHDWQFPSAWKLNAPSTAVSSPGKSSFEYPTRGFIGKCPLKLDFTGSITHHDCRP